MKSAKHIIEVVGPFRQPAWRWYAALKEPATRRQSTGDEWVNAARNFIAARRQTTGRRGKRVAPDPAIAEAEDIYGTPDHQRAELEALLLTNMHLENIANRLGVELGTVDAYANLFFHVRDQLGARDWIFTKVIGSSPENHFAGERDRIWKMFAYAGGPAALDLAIAATLDLPLSPRVLFSDTAADEEKKNRFLMKLCIAITTTSSLSVLASLMEIFTQFIVASGASPEQVAKIELMQDMLELADGKKKSAGRKRATSPHGDTNAPENKSSPLQRNQSRKKDSKVSKVPASLSKQFAEALASRQSSPQPRRV